MKTAKEIIEHANCGIIGIDQNGAVFTGYDESHPFADMVPPEYIFDDEEPPLSAGERAALADEMIARWTRYKNAKV